MTDLKALATKCWLNGWNWIRTNLAGFSPVDKTNPEHMKSISELALLYGLSHGWDLDSESSKITKYLLSVIDDPLLYQLLRKKPGYYSHYAIGYMSLRMARHNISGYEEALLNIAQIGYPDTTEMVPFRRLELKYLHWKSGLSTSRPTWIDSKDTTLSKLKSTAYLCDMDVYSITHTLMYLTDLTGISIKIENDAYKKKAIEAVETLIVHYFRKRDWDICGELLINLISLNRYQTTLFNVVSNALLSAWSEEGILLGPTFSMNDVNLMNQEYIFEHCYHTILVGLLFCGAYIYRLRYDQINN